MIQNVKDHIKGAFRVFSVHAVEFLTGDVSFVICRQTKEKARRRWRLLISNGHGSHITIKFIDFCDANKIL